MTNTTNQKKGFRSIKAWLKLIISIPLTAVIIFSQAIATTVSAGLSIPPLFVTVIGEALPLVLAVVLMIALGGRKWLGTDKESVVYAFKAGWPLLILGVVGSVMNVISSIRKGIPLAEGALVNFIAVVLACLFIGFLEEILYRGISFGTLLGILGGSRVLIMVAVLFSSWLFGRVHVPSMNFGNLNMFLQSLLKIIQTGMLGIVMCDIMLHTKKIGGAALLHAANDFLLMLTGALYEGKSVSG